MLQIYLPVILALFVTPLLAKPGTFLETNNDRSANLLADKDYRLQSEVIVMDYRVNLTFSEESFSSTSDEFTGRVSIIFQISNKLSSIKVHASKKHLKLAKVLLAKVDITEKISDEDWDEDTDLLTLTIARGLSILDTNITLDIEYKGTFSTIGTGLYKSSYSNIKGERQYVINTQLKPIHAREVFPCFDEPHLKAQYYFNITVPNDMKVLFNTPLEQSKVSDTNNAATWHAFERTPAMSTYLIALVVSKELECASGANLDEKTTFEVCSRPEVSTYRAVALEQVPKIVAKLEDITGIKYSDNMPNLNLVALPNEVAKPTENWGLIIATETDFLYNEYKATYSQKQLKERVMSREIAKQWFGDLVTSKWWSETFLSESLASYFEFMTLNEILADWDLSKQFVATTVHASLEADSQNDVLALQSSVETSEDIVNKFDVVSSNKGASIIHMASNIMGNDNFRNGIKEYLKNKKNGNAEASDLWTALQGSVKEATSNLPSKVTLAEVMKNWITLPGYPLLTVSLVDKKIEITQERFLSVGEDKTSKWYVPISYTTSSSTNKFTETNPSNWLTPEDEKLTLEMGDSDSWIILNNQQSAYYRVNYEEALWSKIAEGLQKSDFDGIHELNRAQIVHDVFALYKLNKLSFEKVLSLTSFLKNEVSLSVWSSAISYIDNLNNRISQPDLKEKYQEYILTLMEKFYNAFPVNVYEGVHLDSVTQQLAVVACRFGNKNCIELAQKIFKTFTDSKSPLSKDAKNVKGIVYCTGIRKSTSETDWTALWDVLVQETDPQERVMYINALGCTNDLSLQKKYLLQVLNSDSPLKSSEAETVFQSVYTGSSTGIGTALEFFIEKFEDINKTLGSSVASSIVRGLSGSLNKNLQVEKLKKFIESKENLPEAFTEALTTASANMEWMNTHGDEIFDYFKVDKKDEEDDDDEDDSPSFALISQPTLWILILSCFIRFLN